MRTLRARPSPLPKFSPIQDLIGCASHRCTRRIDFLTFAFGVCIVHFMDSLFALLSPRQQEALATSRAALIPALRDVKQLELVLGSDSTSAGDAGSPAEVISPA